MDSFTQEYFFTGRDGKEYQIYPMKLKYKDKVSRLFNKIDSEYLYLNLPLPEALFVLYPFSKISFRVNT